MIGASVVGGDDAGALIPRNVTPFILFLFPTLRSKGLFGMPKTGFRNVKRRTAAPYKRRERSQAGKPRPASLVVAGAVPLLIALACTGPAGASTASIADQPGVTSPSQPGTATPPLPPAPPPPAPEPQPEPAPEPQPAYVEQPPEVRNGPTPRPEPADDPAPPVQVQYLHLPEPVAPVAPIQPPDNTIRIGQWQAPTPDWLPLQARDCINNTAAGAEAQVATALDSIGIPAGRSDRVSGATLAGAGIGGAAGAVATGAPVGAVGAAVGGLIGGTIGGIAGAAVGTVVPVPVVGTVTSGVAGTALGAAAGAAAGAAIAGIPAAVVGALAGGTVGAGFGAGVGVGQP